MVLAGRLRLNSLGKGHASFHADRAASSEAIAGCMRLGLR